MRPEEVPQGYVERADLAMADICIETDLDPGTCTCATDLDIRTILAAVLPLDRIKAEARALIEAADDIDAELTAVQDKPIEDSAWDRYDAMVILTKWLRARAAHLTTTTEEPT